MTEPVRPLPAGGGKQGKRKRQVVMEVRLRDGDICQCCGNGDGAEVHHIHPIHESGEDALSNAICLCHLCHKFSPDSPEQFLGYQRRGGAFLQRLQEAFTCAANSQEEGLARENLLEATRNHEAIDQIRASNWGWTTGRDAVMRQVHDGELSPRLAIESLRERLDQAEKQLKWRLALAGCNARLNLPGPVVRGSAEARQRAFVNWDRLRISRLMSYLGNSPLPATALKAEYDCAFEDLFEAIGLGGLEVG